MKELILHRGEVALVDDDDFAAVSKFRWYAIRFKKTSIVYAARKVNTPRGRRLLFLHRDLMNAQVGEDVDHRDRDGLNNQRSNLRRATRSQNLGNQKVRCTNRLGVKGVSPSGRRFVARLQARHLGTYDTIEEAAAAYLEAAKSHFGADFATAG